VDRPSSYNTTLTKSTTNSTNILLVDVAVGGLFSEGLEDVFATYTSDPTTGSNTLYGHWSSLRLGVA